MVPPDFVPHVSAGRRVARTVPRCAECIIAREKCIITRPRDFAPGAMEPWGAQPKARPAFVPEIARFAKVVFGIRDLAVVSLMSQTVYLQ